MLVEIWSDIVCPWCYVGIHRFLTALDRYEGRASVEVAVRPFQLDPGAPTTATPALDSYARKFGGPARAVEIASRMTDMAAAEGLELRLEDALRANTFDGHRLVELARRDGRDLAMEQRLMHAYFVEGRDVSDVDVLVGAALDVGLDADDARAFLESCDGIEEVRRSLVLANDLDIHGVPTFVVDGQWVLPGAQEVETFVRVLGRLGELSAGASPGG